MELVKRVAKTATLALGLTGIFGEEVKAQNSDNNIRYAQDAFLGYTIPFLSELQLPYLERNDVFDAFGLKLKIRSATENFLFSWNLESQALEHNGELLIRNGCLDAEILYQFNFFGPYLDGNACKAVRDRFAESDEPQDIISFKGLVGLQTTIGNLHSRNNFSLYGGMAFKNINDYYDSRSSRGWFFGISGGFETETFGKNIWIQGKTVYTNINEGSNVTFEDTREGEIDNGNEFDLSLTASTIFLYDVRSFFSSRLNVGGFLEINWNQGIEKISELDRSYSNRKRNLSMGIRLTTPQEKNPFQ